MATRKSDTEPNLKELLGGVVGDLEKLFVQHVTLLRSEVQQNLEHAQGAALSFAVGSGLLVGSGVLATQAVAQALQRLTGLPLWACYAALAGLSGGAALKLLDDARERAARVQLAPVQTARTLKEDLEWLQTDATQALT